MKFKLLLILATLTRYLCGGSFRMLSSLMRHDQKVQFRQEQLDRILEFTFTFHDCVQVTADETIWAKEVLCQIYATATNTSFVNGVDMDLKSCSSYVLIAKTFSFVMSVLNGVKFYYDNRVLVLIGGSHHTHLETFVFNADGWFHDSEVLLAVLGKPTRFFIRKQPKEEFSEISALEGSWSVEPNGVTNFSGRTVAVGTFNCSVFSDFGQLDEFQHPSWVDGVELTFVRDVFKILNITLKIVVPSSDDKWGVYDSNDEAWKDGVMGLLTKKDVDIAFCGLWIVPNMRKMETAFPVAEGCLKALVPKPVFLDSGWFSIFHPFTAGTWIFTAASVVIATVVLYFLSYLVNGDDRSVTFTQCLLWTISMMLAQGGSDSLRRLQQVIIWLITLGFILTTCYCSSLITQITSPTLSLKMDSIQLLVENGFIWTAPNSMDTELMFDLNDTWESVMAKRLKIIPDQRKEWEEIAAGKVALIGQQYNSNAFILDSEYPNELLERYEITKNCICKYSIGLVLRRGSPYFTPINKYVLRYLSAGILSKIVSDGFERIALTKPYVREVFDVTKATVKSNSKINLRNLKGAFLIWGLGLLTSALAFLMEWTLGGRSDRRKAG